MPWKKEAVLLTAELEYHWQRDWHKAVLRGTAAAQENHEAVVWVGGAGRQVRVHTTLTNTLYLPSDSQVSPEELPSPLPGCRPVFLFFRLSLDASDSMMSTRRVSTLPVMDTLDPSCSNGPPFTW